MVFQLRVWRFFVLSVVVVLIVLSPVVARAIAPFRAVQATSVENRVENRVAALPLKQQNTPARLPMPMNFPQTINSPGFMPRQEVVSVHSSNYDYRMSTDIAGNPIHNDMIVVLHETVGSAGSAINTFQRENRHDNDQVSYHTLIRQDGTVVYLVPPEMRAFGAGNSVFNGPHGAETVRLDPVLPPSVNNFAYHAALESPADGRGNGSNHSGYTDAQYASLAWLIAQTNIPESRITTHRAVDRSGSRRDPRSFDTQKFFKLLSDFRLALQNQEA
jgi:N-acetyl-anhydromuramyl-L-alanine amidase AmpD